MNEDVIPIFYDVEYIKAHGYYEESYNTYWRTKDDMLNLNYNSVYTYPKMILSSYNIKTKEYYEELDWCIKEYCTRDSHPEMFV